MKKTMQVVGTIRCGKPRFWLDGEEVFASGGTVVCDRVLVKGAFIYREEEDGPDKSGYASAFVDATEYAAKWRENCVELTLDVVTTTIEHRRSEAGREYDDFSVSDGEYDPESLAFVEREKPTDRAAAFLARCKKQWAGFPKVTPVETDERGDDSSEDIANA